MDQLPSELLAAVCSFLPWRDRLLTRRLSSKFRNPPLIPVAKLEIANFYETEFGFYLRFQEGETIRKESICLYARSEWKEDFTFSKIDCNYELSNCTGITCTRPYYDKFIGIYMNLLVSVFRPRNLTLESLNSEMLAKLRGIFERAHPNLDWQKDKRSLEICNQGGFSQEELKFLKLCRNPELLRITPPWESKLEDFWELAFVCDTKQLVVDCGQVQSWRHVRPVAVEMGIGDVFLDKVIRGEKHLFVSNTKSRVSLDFLTNYITNCLAGGHALRELLLHRRLETDERNRLVDFLQAFGFEELGKEVLAVQIKRETGKGYHPDQFIVRLDTAFFIRMQADYACYRGKESLQKQDLITYDWDFLKYDLDELLL